MERIAVLSGGSGAYALLREIKKYPVEVSSVVPMVDSGGSTGRLREEFGTLPTGDIRKCISALSPDPLIDELLNFRFKEGEALAGHTFGNILLTALKEMLGSDAEAFAVASAMLRAKGSVYPSTLDSVHLGFEYVDGEKIVGEAEISEMKGKDKRVKKVWLEPEAKAYGKAIETIINADVVVLGPANLYRTIVPTLLVEGIVDAIDASNGCLIFVCNLLSREGFGYRMTSGEHLDVLSQYLGKRKPDVVVVNTGLPPKEVKPWMEEGGYAIVKNDISRRRGFKLLRGKYGCVSNDPETKKPVFRHDAEKLALDLVHMAKRHC